MEMQRSDQPGEAGSATASELSTEFVDARLREAILRGELDPRMPISQVQLAARLGVSRTPLREALRMLQREGLIDSPPNRRVRVAELSITDLEQVYARRVLVEALAVRLTVPRYTPEDLAELRAALSAMNRPLEGRHIDAWEAEHRRYDEVLRRYGGGPRPLGPSGSPGTPRTTASATAVSTWPPRGSGRRSSRSMPPSSRRASR